MLLYPTSIARTTSPSVHHADCDIADHTILHIDSRLVVTHTTCMSKRLQVVIEDSELEAIQNIAREQKISVAEWVRRALRDARQSQPRFSADRKLRAIRHAVQCDFPTADIDQMLGEIKSGYGAE